MKSKIFFVAVFLSGAVIAGSSVYIHMSRALKDDEAVDRNIYKIQQRQIQAISARKAASVYQKSLSLINEEIMVFKGTVFSISPWLYKGKPSGEWLIKTKVDEVLAGYFTGHTFEFFVHNPAKSRLEIGEQYEIESIYTGAGYDVDEDQFIK